MRYEIPETLKGTYRQMTIDTPAVLDTDGFDCDDPAEADAIIALIEARAAEQRICAVDTCDDAPLADSDFCGHHRPYPSEEEEDHLARLASKGDKVSR